MNVVSKIFQWTLGLSLIIFSINIFAATAPNIKAEKNLASSHLRSTDFYGFTDFVISPNQSEIYATYVKQLFIIDNKSGKTINTVTLPIKGNDEISNLVITPNGRKIYLSTFSQKIFIFDIAQQQLIGQVKNKFGEPTSCIPNGMIISPDGNFLYAVDSSEQRVGHPKFHVIDTVSDIDVQQIDKLSKDDFGWREPGLAFNNSNNRLYITNWFNDAISVFTPYENKLEEDVIPVEGLFVKIAGHPTKNQMYVLGYTGWLSIIDEDTRKESYTMHFGADLHDLTFAENGKILFVSAGERNKIYVISTDRMRIMNFISILKPNQMRLSPDSKSLYVSNSDKKIFYQIDVATNKIIRTISVV